MFQQKGRFFLGGEDISKLEESDLAQIRGKKIGFIFQSFNLIPNLTVKENIMLPMMFQGVEKEERSEIAEKLLDKVDLGDRGDHYPNQISGGQISEVLLDMGKEEEGYELMDTASKITDTQIKGALKEKK